MKKTDVNYFGILTTLVQTLYHSMLHGEIIYCVLILIILNVLKFCSITR
jgi:hypothetical protein